MKLDFKKAYDTVSLLFLFQVMSAFGVPKSILKMVKMLFHGTEATVCIANGESLPFQVQHGVWQGCPLAPYLFLFISKVLNISIKKVIATGELSGIILLEKVDKLAII